MKRLIADTDRFPHETLGGETVVIDAERGHLFLFTGLGPWLWDRMTTGGSIDEVVHEVVEHFGGSSEHSTREFLDLLHTHGLLRDGSVTNSQGSRSSSFSHRGEPLPESFQAATLEHFDEIADIISMDPIHEVDPSKGWPNRKPESLGDDTN